MHNIYIYILVMFLVSLTLRVGPILLIKKPIENKYVKSFLYYVPYITLAVMTFPAVMSVTDNYLMGLIAMIVSILAAYFGCGYLLVAVIASAVVLILEFII